MRRYARVEPPLVIVRGGPLTSSSTSKPAEMVEAAMKKEARWWLE
jgi:hypothetical protein